MNLTNLFQLFYYICFRRVHIYSWIYGQLAYIFASKGWKIKLEQGYAGSLDYPVCKKEASDPLLDDATIFFPFSFFFFLRHPFFFNIVIWFYLVFLSFNNIFPCLLIVFCLLITKKNKTYWILGYWVCFYSIK